MMENNGGEAIDDQGSGWFEVKKRHKSSSKFSLQSWVGVPDRVSPNFQQSQPSPNDRSRNSYGKHKSHRPKSARISGIHEQDEAVNSTPMRNEDNKGAHCLDKCVIKQESKGSKPLSFSVTNSDVRNEDIQEKPQKDKPGVVQKIKWGDLEDDALALHHENSIRAEIKFGDIAPDNLVISKKNETKLDLVSCSSSINPHENKKAAEALDVGSNSHKLNLVTCKGGNCKEENIISSEYVGISIVNDKTIDQDGNDSNCKEVHTEGTNPCNDYPFTTQDAESQAAEISRPEIYGESSLITSVDESSTPPSASCVRDDQSKAQTVNTLGEDDSRESKERFRQRLWCFLFENLNRAVDELYLLCELECDLEQMKEATLVLEEAASDFKELATRVEEFENVKKSSSQPIDGVPITLKTDHCRPHALSWEVRRMATSPHKAEILSSSLEAFKKIQQERASLRVANSAKFLAHECSNCHHVSAKTVQTSVAASGVSRSTKDSVVNSSKLSNVSLGKLSKEKQTFESGKSSKVNFVQNNHESSQNPISSRPDSSRLTHKGTSSSASVKSKIKHVGSESEKLLPKQDKMLSESSFDKNYKSAVQVKRQVPLNERDREKKNATSRKSMHAWKEKRNWEDILSSPFRVSSHISHSPGISRKSTERARILHDKLMSPEKKKKTALDLKKEAEEKHARAMRIRSELENERVQKLQRTSEKLNRVNEWQAVRNMKLRQIMHARHQRSELRHEAYLAQVVRRAGDESSKVNEVRFITSLNEENKKLMLRQKHHDSELRRAEKLQVLRTKQKEDMAREEAVSERRKLIEAEKLQRLAETQRRKEEAQVRREEERKASSAAREARAIEQLRRKEERAKAQQEEAELLAQKLVEKLSESEQRRKFYLEQIRERASMDFRDQSSPLMRRSSYKEGHGRSTPVNNSDDYQSNNGSSEGGIAVATGNVALQHSLKRRIKKIRQRLMALKYEYFEPLVSSENSGVGYRTAVATARVKIGRWLQELQKLRQARKEGAASIGLITAEMIKFLEGKDPELHASRQAGLIDFIASALPASHTSKPEACQVTIHLLKLLKVMLSLPANRSYFLAQNLLPPIIPMLSAALENYVKIAASLNAPGGTSLTSSKVSVENFESISQILDGFLWTVAAIIGHASSGERQLQMHDGLLELLIAYQVIHRLRDLYALYDRPQVEGSPFPSSILLSISLLVVLTSCHGNISSIDWGSVPGNENPEEKLVVSADSGDIFANNTCGDGRLSSSITQGSSRLADVPEEMPLDYSCKVVDENKPVSSGENSENKLNNSLVQPNARSEKTDVQDGSPKIPTGEKDEKHLVDIATVQKNENTLSLKHPVGFILTAISETGLVSLPSLLTFVLLQANNRLSSEQASYMLPSNFEEVAMGVLKVLNNLARLDIAFLQRMLARPDLKMEFFHLMSFLLSHCTCKWKVVTDQVGLLLLESLLLLGYFALFHSENQAVLRWGKSPTILHKVCDLPFVFFSDPELMPILAGTLVAACYGCEQNKAVVQQELSMDMLLSSLRTCRNVLPAVRSNQTLETLAEDSGDLSQQQGSELRKFGRYNPRSSRMSLGRGGTVGNSTRVGKTRNQRDSKVTKACEDTSSKQNNNGFATDASLMLHCRFPSSFIDKAEQYFSAETTNPSDEVQEM